MKLNFKTCLLCCVLLFVCNLKCNNVNGLNWPFTRRSNANWQGRWFPQSPDKAVDDNPLVEYHTGAHQGLFDSKHGIQMGVPSPFCDDGKTNLTIDWDNSPINYTCYDDRHAYLPKLDVHPILHTEFIPKQYMAPHRCMNTSIFYENRIPTFGTHRPLWPKYGEYAFVPKQRWLHSLEHGAVVMLHHPCAHEQEVALLSDLVKKCLYRHIITPYTLLLPERPLALVTWGNSLEMPKVVPKLVIDFIRNYALKGPEQKSEDGQFEYGLMTHAQVVSDINDNNLCPRF